jgi:hypothetical protein
MICNSNVQRVVAIEWYAQPEITHMLKTAEIQLEVKRAMNAGRQ